MEWASKESLSLLYFLLPGFLAAWVFYGLTAHPKKEPFERVVQALIFTLIVQAANVGARKVWWHFHRAGSFWTDDKALVSSVGVAALVGLLFAIVANWDFSHRVLRKLRVTKRTSYPSEWYSAFHRHRCYVTLHLTGERRLYGWPEEWPDQCDRGHFLIEQPQWVLDSGEKVPLRQLKRMMVPASDVGMVEIEFAAAELPQTGDQIIALQKPLAELHTRKDSDNGRQRSTAAAAASTAEAIPPVANGTGPGCEVGRSSRI